MKKTGIFVVLVIGVIQVLMAQSSQSKAESLFNDGETHFQNGRYNEAINSFTQAIRLDQDYAEAYFYRGYAYLDTNDLNKALSDFNKAIELLYDAVGRVSGGIVGFSEELNRLLNLEVEPRLNYYANAYLLRGVCWARLENHDRAIEDSIMATKINPYHETAYYNLGNYYGYKECFDDAIIAFEKTVEINQKNADAWIFLGLSYSERNLPVDYPRVKQCSEEYLRLAPNGEYANNARDVINQLREMGY